MFTLSVHFTPVTLKQQEHLRILHHFQSILNYVDSKSLAMGSEHQGMHSDAGTFLIYAEARYVQYLDLLLIEGKTSPVEQWPLPPWYVYAKWGPLIDKN